MFSGHVVTFPHRSPFPYRRDQFSECKIHAIFFFVYDESDLMTPEKHRFTEQLLTFYEYRISIGDQS